MLRARRLARTLILQSSVAEAEVQRGRDLSRQSLFARLACGCLLTIAFLSAADHAAGEEFDRAVPVIAGTVTVGPGDGRQLPFSERRRVSLDFPPPGAAPVLRAGLDGPGYNLLRRLVAEGKAAGNHGDLYENRDRGHSELPAANHPQLARIRYDSAARKARMDYGLSGPFVFDAPLIGNSSTALKTGLYWRSLPRLALTTDAGRGVWPHYQNYLAGQIHVYPEHRDHDPETGDVLPANTPYMLISQGSSGSDRAHLQALAMIFAALRPDTKAFLRAKGLLAPTVQMVYRRARAPVRSRGAYFSGIAHPTAFSADDINLAHMVRLANSLTPDAVPPMVRLKVEEETMAREGVDFFGEGLSERLFDTPSAIARIWRSTVHRREMIVSAEATEDPNGHPLRFIWAVLRGDPERVRIEPLDPEGRRARIEIEWQNPRPVPGNPAIISSRIDIGVFAHNGRADSAPAFLTILLPWHESRDYGQGPDGTLRIESLDRGIAPGRYADPVLFPRADWRDVYRYAEDGALLGWDRHTPNGIIRFTPTGERRMRDGTPVPVRHAIEHRKDDIPRVVLDETPRAASGGASPAEASQ